MFKCEFSTGNASFYPSKRIETERLLRALADKISEYPGLDGGPIKDTNGNKIGAWSLTEG